MTGLSVYDNNLQPCLKKTYDTVTNGYIWVKLTYSPAICRSILGVKCVESLWIRDHSRLYGGFLKWWYPQIIHFNMVFHYKPSILGYPYFWTHPYVSQPFPPGDVVQVREFPSDAPEEVKCVKLDRLLISLRISFCGMLMDFVEGIKQYTCMVILRDFPCNHVWVDDILVPGIWVFGWWFQLYIIYMSYFCPYIMGKMNPFGLFWIKGVETTNQLFVDAFFYGIHHWRDIFFLLWNFFVKKWSKAKLMTSDGPLLMDFLYNWVNGFKYVLCSTKKSLICLKWVGSTTN